MPGLLSDCALETRTISGSLSLPDGPEEQCGLGSMDAPGLYRLGLLEAVWTLRHIDPGLWYPPSFIRKKREKKSLHASVSPSSNWV